MIVLDPRSPPPPDRRFISVMTRDTSDLPKRYPEEWEGFACMVIYVHDDTWSNLYVPERPNE